MFVSVSPTVRGVLGAHAKWSKTADWTAATAAGRAAARTALDTRLIQENDLDTAASNFEQRLAHARSLHFKQLALASAKVRSRRGKRGAE
jgi:hypothetical protein